MVMTQKTLPLSVLVICWPVNVRAVASKNRETQQHPQTPWGTDASYCCFSCSGKLLPSMYIVHLYLIEYWGNTCGNYTLCNCIDAVIVCIVLPWNCFKSNGNCERMGTHGFWWSSIYTTRTSGRTACMWHVFYARARQAVGATSGVETRRVGYAARVIPCEVPVRVLTVYGWFFEGKSPK